MQVPGSSRQAHLAPSSQQRSYIKDRLCAYSGQFLHLQSGSFPNVGVTELLYKTSSAANPVSKRQLREVEGDVCFDVLATGWSFLSLCRAVPRQLGPVAMRRENGRNSKLEQGSAGGPPLVRN